MAGRWRLAVKAAFLLLFLLLCLSGTLPQWLDSLTSGGADSSFAPTRKIGPEFLKGVLPSLSPIGVLLPAMGQRALCLLDPFIIAIVALGLAFWRGRFFCAWICPMGTLAELESKAVGKGFLKKFPKLNGAIFWAALTGALLGMPILLALDPLSSFNRLGMFLHPPFPLAALIPAAMVLLVLALGLLKPMLWCSGVCPLGYALGLAQRIGVYVTKLRVRKGADREMVSEVRRDLVKGVCAGLPLAIVSEGLLVTSYESNGTPVLPPGASNAVSFHAACTRCYACVQACPSKVITVKMPANTDISSWFAPQVSPDKSACWEDCNRCSQVCAPGAIKHLPMELKRNTQIGVAKINRSKCIAWAKGDACMVCDEYCPYHAIAIDTSPEGVSRPVVKKDECRGCGFCQMACPVSAPVGPAIKVAGVLNQRLLKF